MLSRWQVVLRMARREAKRHRLRYVVTALLVALPVSVGVLSAQFHYNTRSQGEQEARSVLGGADAEIVVTRFPRVYLRYLVSGALVGRPAAFATKPGVGQVPVHRDPNRVRLRDLLPAGTVLTPAPDFTQAELASGGTAQVMAMDAGTSLAEGLVTIADGVTPTQPEQAAVPKTMASELSLLDGGGRLRPGATLQLADGTPLRVVGILGESTSFGATAGPARILVPAESILDRRRSVNRYLIGLPAISLAAKHRLVHDLAAHGVTMKPREVYFNPVEWGAHLEAPSQSDSKGVALGVLAVAAGLVEVLVIVGSVFMISTRRRLAELSLLSSIGAGPADLRRVVLAQGLVLGIGASLAGGAAGLVAFRPLSPAYEALSHQELWTHDVNTLAVLAVVLAGSLSGLAAASLPALRAGKDLPTEVMRRGFTRGSRRLPRLGSAVLAIGTTVTAIACARLASVPTSAAHLLADGIPWPVGVAMLGLVLILVGLLILIPSLVDGAGSLARKLPVSGRYAFREAARHRARTSALITMLVMIGTAALITVGTVHAVIAASHSDGGAPAHSLTVSSLQQSGVQRSTRTVHAIVGSARRMLVSTAAPANRGDQSRLQILGGPNGYDEVGVVDEATLRFLGADAPAVKVYRAGGVVRTVAGSGGGRLVLFPRPNAAGRHWTLPAANFPARFPTGSYERAWISPRTARDLGLAVRPSVALFLTRSPVTREELDRLAVHGLIASSPDVPTSRLVGMERIVFSVTGLACMVLVSLAVALSAAESRGDSATMSALGASPWTRRAMGAMHGLLIGSLGAMLALAVGCGTVIVLLASSALSRNQLPLASMLALALALPAIAATTGWCVSPRRLTLVRRED